MRACFSVWHVLPAFLSLSFLGCPADDDDASSPAAVSPSPSVSQIEVSVSELDFGEVASTSPSSLTVTVGNEGEKALNLTVSLPENPSYQFAVYTSGGELPDTLEAGTTLELLVSFTPLENGPAEGILRIDTTDAVKPRVDVALSAVGVMIEPTDEDGDGFSVGGGDCDDMNEDVYPGADEICDELDNDCDKDVDEEGATLWYPDLDQDGYGNSESSFLSCAPGGDAVSSDGDCDDSNAAINPDAIEVCDGEDNDCNGTIDENVTLPFYFDSDGDGYGITPASGEGCEPPEGFSLLAGDCDDQDADVNPSALEVCDGRDNDCDGGIDDGLTVTVYVDADQDGFGDPASLLTTCEVPDGYVTVAEDCDDQDPQSYPSADETCDGADNDCDGRTDEEGDLVVYPDQDGDGFGVSSGAILSCSAGGGYALEPGDCQDQDIEVYPGAAETCDGKDNDCDKAIDEAGNTLFYRDADGDGHGDPSLSLLGCGELEGYVAQGDDCNDRDAGIHPGAPELCNGQDDDCDGTKDEDVGYTWYLDADRDGFGEADGSLVACSQPNRYVAQAGDCDDLDASVYPMANEVCDEQDNDCNAEVDEGLNQTFYVDDDRDGYGDPLSPLEACERPQGSADDGTDCDDSDPLTYPEAEEICDGADNDCDKSVDEEALQTFYADKDGDGYGVSSTSVQSCTAPGGYVTNDDDCNDASSTTHPLANELCDGSDNDCDLEVDEGVTQAFYVDQDGDKYGNPDKEVEACRVSSGLVTNSLDCDDSDSTVYPTAVERCDDKDNNCDGRVDEPGGADQTLYYRDEDGDTFGVSSSILYACQTPAGYASQGGDCDDEDDDTYPGALERCEGKDNDCDGVSEPPEAPEATANTPLCVGSTLSLSASAVSGASYAWTGPSGFTSSLQNLVLDNITADADGLYLVTATREGCESDAGSVDVSVIEPDSGFTSNVTEPAVSQSVTFTPDTSGATYAWTFQGGSPASSTSASPSVSWSAKGTYTVTLRVTLYGCSTTSSSTITVTDTYLSCKDLKARNPSATDGTYTIDPDGSGSGASMQVYCDMTTDGGGWTLIYFVDAVHFDGYVANNKTSQGTAPAAINEQGDMWNPPSSLAFTQSLFACTTQSDAGKYYWRYDVTSPITWYTNTTTDYGYQTLSSSSSNSSYPGTCQSTHKAESGYGFIVIEGSNTCGSCSNMLFGNYHYPSGSQCNSTSTTYGVHGSPYRSASIGYPLCNKQQTSNGKFWIGVR